MILTSNQFLSNARITAILREVEESYQRDLPLTFLDRTPTIDAEDAEITGSYTGRTLAADIIMDDQAALVYDTGQFEFVTNAIPNLKLGQRVTQAKMNLLRRMGRGLVGPDESGMFDQWLVTIGTNLRRGVDERKNALIAAMNLDLLTYDRFGIKLSVNWGMPSNLKATPSTPWTTAASATPITDILTMKEFARTTYGERYDRITMATSTFRLVVATTEFKNLIVGVMGQPVTATAYNALDPKNESWFSQMIGMTIELEDKVYWEQSAAGVTASTRVQPANKVLLSSKADDGNAAAMDFANAIVNESQVNEIVGGNDSFGGEAYGPIAYWEGGLNPPNLIAWGVARGFPRKHRKTATAVLTVAA
jgi:hypothetical protein